MNEPAVRPPTPFEHRVFDALSLIPRGRVTTYKLLAKFIGCRSSQAVGQALRRNPFAPGVPCHRVIGHDLRIGGYSGETAGPKLRKKLNLLAAEGVTFTADGHLAPGHEPWDFSCRADALNRQVLEVLDFSGCTFYNMSSLGGCRTQRA